MAFLSYAQPNQILLFEGRSQISGSSKITTYLDGELLDWSVLQYRILEALNLSISRSKDTFYFTNITADESIAKIRVTYQTYYADIVINVFKIVSNEDQWEETEEALFTPKKVGVGGEPDLAEHKVFGNSEVTEELKTFDLNVIRDILLYEKEGYLKSVEGLVGYLEKIPWGDIDAPGQGERKTGIDAGILGELSIDDNFLYICLYAGEIGTAIWKRIQLHTT